MPPRRSPASSSSGGGAAAEPSGRSTSKPSARSGSHPKPPSALEMALDTFLDDPTRDDRDALAQAGKAAPTELVTPRHIEQLIVMLVEPCTAPVATVALLGLGNPSPDRRMQFGGEGALMCVGPTPPCPAALCCPLLFHCTHFQIPTRDSTSSLPPSPASTATRELFQPLADTIGSGSLGYCTLNICSLIASAAAATPNAAAAVAAFTPPCAKILRMAAAAATGDYPAGMDRAAAQATLRPEDDDSYSPAQRACGYLHHLVEGKLPEQHCKVLVQQCLDSLIKLLGTPTEQADLTPLREAAAGAIGLLPVGGKGVAAAMRKEGGQRLLRVLSKALAADTARVADVCTHALLHLSNDFPMEVGLALKAVPGALPRLLMRLDGEVRIVLRPLCYALLSKLAWFGLGRAAATQGASSLSTLPETWAPQTHRQEILKQHHSWQATCWQTSLGAVRPTRLSWAAMVPPGSWWVVGLGWGLGWVWSLVLQLLPLIIIPASLCPSLIPHAPPTTNHVHSSQLCQTSNQTPPINCRAHWRSRNPCSPTWRGR